MTRRAPDNLAPALHWAANSLCAQTYPALFFPERGEDNTTAVSKQICRRCPVIEECLAEAMRQEGTASHSHRYGVWGGLSPAERADLAKARARWAEAA
ncbi:WhiB family transcriptional regulator [Streptomyces sp. NPDC090022]|uniref:WhiB family transcriptional regulator n=1 Tax=Streptomyces sp. NPDC090022 TaxID=3365920 RepID=UPI00381CA956